jgi:hypothetical protein
VIPCLAGRLQTGDPRATEYEPVLIRIEPTLPAGRTASRRAAAVALIVTASLEIALFVGSTINSSFQQGRASGDELLILLTMCCAIIDEAFVIWFVVGHDRTANPTRRALLCLIVAIFPFMLAFPQLGVMDGPRYPMVIAAGATNIALMAVAILIAIGLVRLWRTR